MSNRKYFSYIRVSTQRQGQQGTSLAEQQAAIERFAHNWSLPITKRFEERETAAKQGRPVFLEMIKQLRQGKAQGVIIHKIDRSARNLKDWADLGSLIDSGLEIHFASESLDLNSRGGRLSADIQAVVAADYIRNLREETRKGIYGRLKQGLYPFPAVVGYLDSGKGKPKQIDPVVGPLVKKAFELYSTGRHGLISLSETLYGLGLRTKSGKKISINGLSTILHNEFYAGVIRIERTGESFAGIHKSIVSRSLFNQVQGVFEGKNIKKESAHFFAYRRLIRCSRCGYLLIAERQKGIVYYRCHTRRCTSSCLRETVVDQSLARVFKQIEFEDGEFDWLGRVATDQLSDLHRMSDDRKRELEITSGQIKERLSRLIDSYMDGILDKEDYFQTKNRLIVEQQQINSQLASFDAQLSRLPTVFDEFLELAGSAYLSLKSATLEQKRELVSSVTSNLTADGKSLSIKLKTPFELLASRPAFTPGSPKREARRTITTLARSLVKFFVENSQTLEPDSVGLRV